MSLLDLRFGNSPDKDSAADVVFIGYLKDVSLPVTSSDKEKDLLTVVVFPSCGCDTRILVAFSRDDLERQDPLPAPTRRTHST